MAQSHPFPFAWYQGSQAAGQIRGSRADQIATAKVAVDATTDIGVTVGVTQVSEKALVLAEWYDTGTDGNADAYRSAYYNTNTSSPVYVAHGTNQVYSKAYEVAIAGIDNVNGYTIAQLATLIKAKGFTVTITVNANLAEAGETTPAVVNPFAARTHVWASKKTGTGTPDNGSIADDAAPGASATFTYAANDPLFGEWDGSSSLTLGWVALYVDGSANTNDGANELNTKVTVAIAELS